jgi:DNA modification methylase
MRSAGTCRALKDESNQSLRERAFGVRVWMKLWSEHLFSHARNCLRRAKKIAAKFRVGGGGGATSTGVVMTNGNSSVGPATSLFHVEYWALERLIPSPRNARTHSPAQIAEIAGSIRAFGFTNPILASEDGDVIAGHGRLAAARLLGMAEIPVILLRGLSDLQRRQLVLADNRIALNSGWDLEMLGLELKDLAGFGIDLSSLGFTSQELAAALSPGAKVGHTDENEIPDLAEAEVSRPGDIWCLGAHRLACGDSTNEEVVRRLIGDAQPRLMVTDPPYGVEYDPSWRHRAGVNNSARTGKVQNDGRADWEAAWQLFPGNIAYVWHGALHATTVADSLTRQGFTIRAQIIWAKERLVIGRGDYHWQHEPCWYAVRNKGNWCGDRKQTTLWTISSRDQDNETTHGTQKPVECMRRPMLNNTEPGQAVYDPFVGSGTTLIAAETSGRVCFSVEISPSYVDLSVRRWQTFAGTSATLLEDGRTFDAIKQERLKVFGTETAQDSVQLTDEQHARSTT